MKQPGRIYIILFILAIVIILGIVFWPFVLNEILTPTALTAWLFLRIFVLSIDQKIYWCAIILGAIFFLFRHPVQFLMTTDTETEPLPEENVFLRDVEFWRSFFTLYTRDKKEQSMVKRELAHLLVSMYASKQGVTANYLVMEALKNGDIPLPESIYAFLFVDEQTPSQRSFKQILKNIWLAPRRWMDERSGRQAAEYYRMIAEVLNFMETSLEIKKR